jgi:hypothetical protein
MNLSRSHAGNIFFQKRTRKIKRFFLKKEAKTFFYSVPGYLVSRLGRG